MLEQISWSYSFSSNNWWKLAIIAIVLKIVSGLMYAWLDDTNSIAYGITAIVGYVMYLFIGVTVLHSKALTMMSICGII